MSFVPIRTGDEQLDRIQDRIRDAQAELKTTQTEIASRLPTSSDAISTKASRIIPLGTPAVTIHDTASDVRLMLPDARLSGGKNITFNYATGGAFTTTILPGNVGGRRQTISGASSKVLAVGESTTLSSNGSDWLVQ